MLQVAWLIPLLPFIAFWAILFRGRRLPGEGAYVAIGALGLSGLLSLVILGQVMFGGRYQATMVWATMGDRPLAVGYAVDPLTAVMLFVVTVVGSLIFIYSVGYMHGDPRYPRFFAYLSLFAASMLLLVLANNFLVLYAGWELVGLCSYLLSGFWFERPAAARASMKAFVTTRAGEFFMFLGILLLFFTVGSLQFDAVFAAVQTGSLAGPLLTLAAVLIFGGAVGKSAQIPLRVWLPDAMEGPTPVSALIHAATMVAAGVYLVARTYELFFSSPDHLALTVVAYIGGLTALMAATIGIVQDDIKRVLAYSTISQLGYMMLGLGVLGYTAGVFHLMTHAFFKAPLIVLAAFSGVIGLVGAPWPLVGNMFHRFVHFEAAEGAPFDLRFAALSTAIAGAGILAAAVVYRWQLVSSATLRRVLAPVYAVLVHKYWWDEFYAVSVVRPVVWVAQQLRTFDVYAIDGAVNAIGVVFVWLSRLSRVFDLYVVDGAVNLVGWLAKAAGGRLRHVQTGRAQNYLLVIALGVIVLAVIGLTR